MQTRLPNGQIIYQEDYSCIVQPQNGKGGIYVGNLEAAQNIKTLRKHGIRAILTAAKGVDLNHSKSQIPFYLQVPGEDRDGFDMTRYFLQSVNFIRDALQNTSIMVHCLAGVSRSVCLLLAYFIKHKGMSYDEAYNLVKIKRSIIHPNQGFISQLRKYETQVRSSCISPSRIEAPNSPQKRRYQYYYGDETCRNNPQMAKYQNIYSSPLKKQNADIYSRGLESPQKKSFEQLFLQNREASQRNRLYGSPAKNRMQTADQYSYQPTNLKKLYSYKQKSYQKPQYDQFQMRHISPQRKRLLNNNEQKGRSNSIIDIRQSKNVETSRLYENYNRLRHTSAVQLSQELDNKIAAIRQKYSEYTNKSQLSNSRRISARESQPRVNNYMDQNEFGLTTNLTMKKFNSQYDQPSNKINSQYGVIGSNYNRSVGIGLGLRKLNSLRQGY